MSQNEDKRVQENQDGDIEMLEFAKLLEEA